MDRLCYSNVLIKLVCLPSVPKCKNVPVCARVILFEKFPLT